MTAEAPVTPLQLPAGAGRLVLFGGTFDPPHRAHVELPLAARKLIEKQSSESTYLVFVPAARSPHKDAGPEAGDADRLEMLRLALKEADHPERTLIWTDEIDRAAWARRHNGKIEPSYMVDTVRRAATVAPECKLSLLIGADQALSFHRWREARRLLELADVFVLPRGETNSGKALVERLRPTRAWSETELERWQSSMLALPTMDVAATPVREWLREPSRHETELSRALGEKVLAYLQSRGLYAR